MIFSITLDQMTKPFFSIVIVLTDKNSYLLPFTLDSIAREENDSSFEVIIVDGSRGVVLSNLPVEGVKLIKSMSERMGVMLNQGLMHASGEYIHYLFPGEFYASNQALVFIKKMIQGYHFPDLIYTPRRVRHQFGQPTVDLLPLTIPILKQAEVPWNLQAYFFRRETIVILGGFSDEYEIEWGYDLLCRLFLEPMLRKAFVKRVLTDYEYRKTTPDWIVRRSIETTRISFKHFGLTRYLFLWMMQNCLCLFRFSWRIVHASFWNKHVKA
jgi:hypothetical protein